VEINLLFKAASFAQSAAKFLAYIQDKQDLIMIRLDRLTNSELDAGVRALQQAMRSEVERSTLLREARSRFNKAIGLEKHLRLYVARVGLFFCHHYLGDIPNADDELERIGSRLSLSDFEAEPLSIYERIFFRSSKKEDEMLEEVVNIKMNAREEYVRRREEEYFRSGREYLVNGGGSPGATSEVADLWVSLQSTRSALSSALSVAGLFALPTWSVRECSWLKGQYEVTSPFAILLVLGPESLFILHGPVADIEANADRILAPLRSAGVAYEGGCYGEGEEPLREFRWGNVYF
jgi:hypothetical protein